MLLNTSSITMSAPAPPLGNFVAASSAPFARLISASKSDSLPGASGTLRWLTMCEKGVSEQQPVHGATVSVCAMTVDTSTARNSVLLPHALGPVSMACRAWPFPSPRHQSFSVPVGPTLGCQTPRSLMLGPTSLVDVKCAQHAPVSVRHRNTANNASRA